jgi:hypothetical protein
MGKKFFRINNLDQSCNVRKSKRVKKINKKENNKGISNILVFKKKKKKKS